MSEEVAVVLTVASDNPREGSDGAGEGGIEVSEDGDGG